jgi:hypothetical protein
MRGSAIALSIALHLAPFGWPLLRDWFRADAHSPVLLKADQGRVKQVVSVVFATKRGPDLSLSGERPQQGASVDLPEIGEGVRREFLPTSMGNISEAARYWGAKLRATDNPYSAEGMLTVLFCNPEHFPLLLNGLYKPGQIVTYEFPADFRIALDQKAQQWASAKGLQGEVQVIRAAFTARKIPYFEVIDVSTKDSEPSACSIN